MANSKTTGAKKNPTKAGSLEVRILRNLQTNNQLLAALRDDVAETRRDIKQVSEDLDALRAYVRAMRRQINMADEDILRLLDEQNSAIQELTATQTQAITNADREIQEVLEAVNRGTVDRDTIRQAVLRLQTHTAAIRQANEGLAALNTRLQADDAGGQPPPPPNPGGPTEATGDASATATGGATVDDSERTTERVAPQARRRQ